MGLSENEAAIKLRNMKASSIHELVFQNGVNLAETPAWQRCGVLVFRETYEKKGFDPIKKADIMTQRTKIVQEWDTPIFNTDKGRDLINRLLSSMA